MARSSGDVTAAKVVERARFWGRRIVAAESCTGGMVCAALTDVPGSSHVLDRGFVTYSNAAKVEMLGVRPETLEAHGAVSEPVAIEMAEGARAHSRADMAVAITGIAGPGGSEFKPEGRVCFALSQSGAPAFVQTIDFGALGRANVREQATAHALALLLAALE